MLTVYGDIVEKTWLEFNLLAAIIMFLPEHRPYTDDPVWPLYVVYLRMFGRRKTPTTYLPTDAIYIYDTILFLYVILNWLNGW